MGAFFHGLNGVEGWPTFVGDVLVPYREAVLLADRLTGEFWLESSSKVSSWSFISLGVSLEGSSLVEAAFRGEWRGVVVVTDAAVLTFVDDARFCLT